MELVDNVDRTEAQVSTRIANVIKTKPLAEWLQVFEGSDCCVSPVNTISEALHTVPANERQLLTYLEHPKLGKIPQIASPMLSKRDRQHMCKPVVDSDNEAIKALKELGYSSKQLKEFCRDQVIEFRYATL